MAGMNGVSGSGSMSRNCGMDGMHANSKNNQNKTTKETAASEQNTKTIQASNNDLGKSIDLKA